jgi:hypothetical protein
MLFRLLSLTIFIAGCNHEMLSNKPDTADVADNVPTLVPVPATEDALLPTPLLAPIPPGLVLGPSLHDERRDDDEECSDTDNDGICDQNDQCPGDNSQDSDGDGTPDACDCAPHDADIVQGGNCPDDGNPCTENVCDPAGSAECLTLPSSASTPCGYLTKGLCDTFDFCDGFGTCRDLKKSTRFQCDNFNTECNPPDYCNGVDDGCPNIYALAGQGCGADVDPAVDPCDVKNECDGQGNCEDLVRPDSFLCAPGDDSGCNPDDFCDGVNKICPANLTNEGTLCGSSSQGPCDLHDICRDGICVDTKRMAGAICERAHGACLPENALCDGVSNTCPTPDFAPAGSTCGPLGNGLCNGQGQCTLDHCDNGTGVEADVDNDNYSTACDCDDNDAAVFPGAQCGPPQNACAPTFCDAATKSCLAEDADEGVSCGSDSGMPCLEDPVCDGLGVCENNVPKSSATVCRPASDVCDTTDLCDGVDLNCPSDAVVAAGTPCGDNPPNHCLSEGQCDGVNKVCEDIPEALPDGNTLVSCNTGFSANSFNCDDGTFICSAGVEYCWPKSFECVQQNPVFTEKGKNPFAEDQYGISVAIHQNLAIVGMPGFNGGGFGGDNLGTVLIYQFNNPNSAEPTLIGSVDNPGQDPDGDSQSGRDSEGFGTSVSIFNNRFAVGAPYADFFYDRNTSDTDCDLGSSNNDAGAVYIFRIDSGNFILEARVQGPNIGFPQDQQNNCATEPGEDDGLPSHSYFGYDVAIGADYLLVGAPHPVFGALGFAYTYYRSGNAWGNPQMIGSGLPDQSFAQVPKFGFSVALSPDQTSAAIGAPLAEINGDKEKGYVGLFKSNGTGGAFGPSATSSFTGSDSLEMAGFDVSMSNTLLAVGIPGHDHRVGRVALMSVGNTLGGPRYLESPDPSSANQQFGTAVGLDKSHLYGHVLVISAPQYHSTLVAGGFTEGMIAVYSILQSTNTPAPNDFVLVDWNEGSLYAAGSENAQVGTSVAADSNRLVVGSAFPLDQANNQTSGITAFQFYPY